ncbi:transposable element Tcb1 transposase [Trichonephila clavipes]|nr:transposable element Tcb1 transposase [Trichonephila clavipes]
MANNQSVRRHLDAFTRGRIIGKLEEGRSVTSVAAEFGIAHSIVSRLWRQFQTTGTAIQGFSSGRPRGTTPADDRYIVLQARRNRRQTAGEIARHTTQATGRPISRFTVARRLHGGGLFARRPVRCVPLTTAHRRRHSLWCREHRNWRDNEWGRVLFTDESRFSLSSDSHRILIWRERGSRNHPSNIIERDRYGGEVVWGGLMLGSRTDLHIFDAGSVNGTRYCNEILLPYVRLFRGAMGLQFLFMDDNAPCHRTVAAEQLLESEDIERMDWPARSPGGCKSCSGSLTVSEIATRVKQDISSSWRQAPVRERYEGNRLAALLGTSSRQDGTILARLRNGHTRAQRLVAGLKVYPPCPNCNVTQAAPVHTLACIGCHKSPLL